VTTRACRPALNPGVADALLQPSWVTPATTVSPAAEGNPGGDGYKRTTRKAGRPDQAVTGANREARVHSDTATAHPATKAGCSAPRNPPADAEEHEQIFGREARFMAARKISDFTLGDRGTAMAR